jgi:lipid-A-disaccharide synthase
VQLYRYIIPQIWVWKAKWRFVIGKYIDALGTLFPFEKAGYRDIAFDVQFLGRPFSDEDSELPVHYIPDGPILLLPGSRKAHIHKIFPIMLDTIKQLRKFGEMREIVLVYPDDDILGILQNINKKYGNISIVFVRSGAKRIPAGAALKSSGTMALNCVLAAVPGVVVYRANIFTYGLAKVLVKVTFFHIANILLNRESSREF